MARRSIGRNIASAVLASVLSACTPPRSHRAPAPPPVAARAVAPILREVAVDWPSALLASGGNEPSLHRSRRPGTRGFAWIAAGTPVRLRGGVRNGRARAYVDGPLRVRGFIDVSSLEAVVLERGRIADAPIYVVPGDRVRLRSAEGTRADVEVRATLGHPELARSPTFHGAFPLARLGADLSGSGAGPTPGRTVLLRSVAPLRSQPDGEIVWTLPALDPPMPATVLREDGNLLGVRIGTGPYLVGYVPRSALEPDGSPRKDPSAPEVLDPWAREGDEPVVQPGVQDPWADDDAEEADPTETDAESLPPMLRRAVVRPVWRVRRGAHLVVDGLTMAIFAEPGMAVELDREGARVEVLAAVDETVTVRGTLAAADLSTP